MAKGRFTKAKKRRFWPFLLGMFLYAAVFLTVLYFALGQFWTYIEAYEASRPQNTLKAYVDQLNAESVCDGSEELIAQVDHNLQSEERCREIISEAVTGGITYAKKTSECTENRLVYVLRSGGKVIGSLTMETTAEDRFGFAVWEVTGNEFDMSFLMGQSMTVTVPEDFPVYLGDVLLDSSYIIQDDIRFDELKSFYEDYDILTLVTYEAGPVLGDAALRVEDRSGQEIVIDENTDYTLFLNNCTEAETEKLEDYGREFLKRYIAFTGSAFKSSEKSYQELMNYVVPDSELANRMALALEGLEWAQSRGDELVEVTFNHLISLGGGRYLCDVTYQVDTTGREGVVRTTNSARFVVVDSGSQLLVDTLLTY